MNVGRAITDAMQQRARVDLRWRIWPEADRRRIRILDTMTWLAVLVGWDAGPCGPSGRWWR